MWGSQSNNQPAIGYDPHAEFPWDLRGFEEVPAYQNAQQPFLIYSPSEHSASQLFALGGGGWAPPPCPEAAQAYPQPSLRAPSSSPNYSLLSLSPATPSPSTAFTGSLPTSPDLLLPPLPPLEAPRMRVPQTPRSPRARRSDIVQFEVRGSLGIRVCDVLSNTAQLDASEDRVLERTGVRQIHHVITWPGYDRSGHYIVVQENGLFITRGRLAWAVCRQIRTFVQYITRRQKRPLGRNNQRWAINDRGPGIRLQDLWLVSIVHDGNIWRPEIEAHVQAP